MNWIMQKLPVVVAIAGALTGCSTTTISGYTEEAAKNIAVAEHTLSKAQAGKKVAAAPIGSVQRVEDIYIPVRKVSATKTTKHRSATLDPTLMRQITVNRTFVSAQELAERMTSLAGILVTVAPDVTLPSGQQGVAASATQAAATTVAPVTLPPLPTPYGNTGSAYSSQTAQANGFPLNLTYSGTLAGLLDVASARMGISWELQDGQIRMFRYTSKTFRLTALPGDTSMDAKIGTSTGSGGVGGASGTTSNSTGSTMSSSSAQSSGVNISSLSVWKGIEESIQAMLSPAGKIIASPALGTVTVTDTPAIVQQVEEFIDHQNAALSRQVVVNVRVLAVELYDTDSYGINWDMVYTSLSENLGMTFKTATAAISGAGNLGLNVLGAADGAKTTNWSGTSAIIEAISTQGKVSTVTSASVTTLNNQPAPLQIGRATSYVASSQTSVSSGVATNSMTTSTINTGFSMSLLPHIMDGKKLLMQFAIDISSLLSLNTITSGDTILQTPDVDTRNSLQRVLVSSGDTIVVAGFENREVNGKSSGVGSAEVPVAGGSVEGVKRKTVLVALMQPIIAE